MPTFPGPRQFVETRPSFIANVSASNDWKWVEVVCLVCEKTNAEVAVRLNI